MTGKTYKGPPGHEHAYLISGFQLSKQGWMNAAVRQWGEEALADFVIKIGTGAMDCTACGVLLVPDLSSQNQPWLWLSIDLPKGRVMMCACKGCFERYGDATKTANMCAEYYASKYAPEAIICDVPAEEGE